MKKILLTALLAAGVATSANAAVPTNPAFSISSNYTGTYALSSKANFAANNKTGTSSNYNKSGKYYLNAGHGGYESDDRPTPMPLLSGDEYFYESEGNLDRTFHLQKWIEQNGGKVSMSRTTNTSSSDLNLTSIATYSSNYGGYFISLHSNGANASANYHVALYKGSNSTNSVGGSKQMAYENSYNNYKNGCLSDYTYATPRSMADYDLMGWHYGVLRTNTAPGYLVETWFHDYRPESLRFKSSLYNKFLAWQIAVGNLTAPGGTGSLPGCIVGDVRDVSKSCGYSNYTARNRDAKKALNDVTVTLSGNGLNQTVNTGSKHNGVYAFFVPAGTYTITVKKDGYQSQTKSLTVTNSKATQWNVDLKEGQDTGISLNPASTGFGETTVGNTSNKTVTVTGTGLSADITITNSDNTNFYVDHTSLGKTGGSFTVRYQPKSAGAHSTTISFVSGSHKASMVVTGTAKNPPLKFTEGWNYSETSNKKAAWMANWTNYRNMAYGNGKLYVVDAANGVVKVINAQTAAHIKDLNMTGVEGGALKLVDVAYVDGKLLGTNIATTAQDQFKTLKVYQWDNDDAAPKVILQTTNLGGMNRIGDAIEIQGNLTSGKICYLGQQTRDYTDAEGATKNDNCNSLVTYAITNGTVSTTPVVADIDAFIIGLSPRAIPDGNNFWVAGQSYLPTQITANGQKTASIPLTAFNIEAAFHGCGNDFVPFTFKGNKYAFATDYQAVKKAGSSATADEIKTTTLLGGRAVLIDGSAGWAVEGLTNSGSYPSAGLGSTTRNTTYSSSICVNVDGDKGVEMWVLVHNQGIAYYKCGSPSATDPNETPGENEEPDPTPSEPSYSTTDDVTGMTEVWNISNASGKTADWITNGSQSVVDMAFANGKLYVANRSTSGTDKLYIVDAYTGSKKGELNISPCTVGTYLISSVEVLGGKVIASNLAAGATSPLKVYIWDNDSATPTELLNTTSHNSVRTGDAMSVSGDLTDGKIWFAYDSNVFYYTVKNGAVTSTEPTVVALKKKDGSAYSISTSTAASNITVESDGSFWVTSKDYRSAHFKSDGSMIEEIGTGLLSSSQGTDLKFVTLGSKKYAVATNYLCKAATTLADGAFELINVTSGLSEATKVGTYPSNGLGGVRNTAFRTSLCTEVNSKDFNVWVMISYQGIAHYKFTHTTESTTGIESVETEVDPVEYYNLQGVRVANPDKGLYIVKQGKKVSKVIL